MGREERNLTRILEKRSVDNLNQQQAYELTNNCALFMAQMAQAIKPEGRSKENVVVTIKALGICANFMKSVALKMTEKLKEEMDGRLIVTHLPEEDDLEVLTAALAKLEEEKSFVQTLQEEDNMAPVQFQNEP